MNETLRNKLFNLSKKKLEFNGISMLESSTAVPDGTEARRMEA